MPSSDVAGLVARCVAEHGVHTVFGLLGEANLAIMLALEREDVEWIAMRREDSVVAAADGFAQGTGGVGVAVVSQGPALANALNPLIGAAKGGTPLVVVTGAVAPDRTHEPQWIDQRALVEATGFVQYRRVDHPTSARAAIAAAFSVARRQRTAVVLEVPTWLQSSSVPAQDLTSFWPEGSLAGMPRKPDVRSAPFTDAVAALTTAKRPVVLAGRGARDADEALRVLARRSGALLGTTLLMKGLFDGDPASLGVVGGFSTQRSRDLIRESDLIVSFGASLNQFTTAGGSLLAGKTVVRVDTAPPRGGSAIPEARLIEVQGDSSVTAAELAARMEGGKQIWHPDPGARDVIEDESDEHGLDLRVVSQWLDDVLPRDRALALDLGYYTSEPSVHIGIRSPDRQAFALHFGSIGLGLATAIGLSRAHPGIPTVTAIGDGGLMSSLQELETVARTRLPMVIAVYDDDAYGVEVYELQHRGEDERRAIFPAVPLASVAAALGIPALTVADRGGLGAASQLLAEYPPGPVLLDFRLRRGVITRWYLDSVHPDFAGCGHRHNDDMEELQ